MSISAYAAFLPAEFRPRPADEPMSTWWFWRGRWIHIARAVRPDSPVRLLLFHGAGGHSGALWPLAALAAREGAEIIAPDMPLYGITAEPRPRSVRYPDWVDLACELICAERERDDRPLIVLGASMGGMLAYEAAARTGHVAHVLATCLLDPANSKARRAAARIPLTGVVAPVLMRAIDPVFGRIRVPIRWLVNMKAMSGNLGLSRLCATDPKGGGTWVPLGFLGSWLTFTHTPPEQFDAAPVTLVHPAADQWTPPELSILFLQRIPNRTNLVLLENCGHYPIEQPGLSSLAASLRAIICELTGPTAQ